MAILGRDIYVVIVLYWYSSNFFLNGLPLQGTPQMPDADELCPRKLDVAFAIDTSYSVAPHFRQILELVKDFSLRVPVSKDAFRISVTLFSTDATVELSLLNGSSVNGVHTALDSVKYHAGSTQTGIAFRVIREEVFTTQQGDRKDVSNLVILITDGPASDHEAFISESRRLNQSVGVAVFAVSLGFLTDPQELEAVAGENVFSTIGLEDIAALSNSLVAGICEKFDPDILFSTTDPTPVRNDKDQSPVPDTTDLPSTVGTIESYTLEVLAPSGGPNSSLDYKPSDVTKSPSTTETYGQGTSISPGGPNSSLDYKPSDVTKSPSTTETYGQGTSISPGGPNSSLDYKPSDVTKSPSTTETYGQGTSISPGGPNSSLDYKPSDVTNSPSTTETYGQGTSISPGGPNSSLDYKPTDVTNSPSTTKSYTRETLAMSKGPNRSVDDNPTDLTKSPPTTMLHTKMVSISSIGPNSSLDYTPAVLLETPPTATPESSLFLTNTPTGIPNDAEECRITEAIDVVFAMDSSQNMSRYQFSQVQSSLATLLKMFRAESPSQQRVGIIQYSDDAVKVLPLDYVNSSQVLQDAILATRHLGGNANLAAALNVLESELLTTRRPGVPQAGIVVTAGLSTQGRRLAGLHASILHHNGVNVFVVGVGDHSSRDDLSVLVGDPKRGSHVFQFHSYPATKDAINQDVLLLCLGMKNLKRNLTDPTTIVHPLKHEDYTPKRDDVTSAGDASLPSSSPCGDRLDNCTGLVHTNCLGNETWARANCAGTCGFCPTNGTPEASNGSKCEDSIANCEDYGQYICTHPSYSDWTREHCSKYCRLCGDSDNGNVVSATASALNTTTNINSTSEPRQADNASKCVDLLPDCGNYGGLSVCSNYKAWASVRCRRYCGFCTQCGTSKLMEVPDLKCPQWRLPSECSLVVVRWSQCPMPSCPRGYVLAAIRQG